MDLSRAELQKYVDGVKEEALETLKGFLKIKSEREDPVSTVDGEHYPYGRGVQDAFVYMLKKGSELGFEVRNVDNYGGHIDFGEGQETVGVLAHVDVVPATGDWDFEPYGGEVADGYIFGRGTTDDKGPLIAAFYAMKALKDAGYEPHRRIRIILGNDEETGASGIFKYFEKVDPPTFGFTPDAWFPVINGEMGILFFHIAKKLQRNQGEGLQLSRLSAGTAFNVVPEKARAVVSSERKDVYDRIKEEVAVYRESTGYSLKTKGVGKSLEIVAEGKAAHGANPWEGLNAISILFDFLGRLSFASDEINEFIEFYNKRIGFNHHGENIGCGFADEPSGKLVWNTGILKFDRDAISISVNIRYPVTYDEDTIYEGILQYMDEYGLGLAKEGGFEPLYFPEDHPLVTTLMDAYRDITGDRESELIVSGGGTYAKFCPNTLAFGAVFPGVPDTMHQVNEKLSIEDFNKSIDVYAEALLRLSGEGFSMEKDEEEQ